MSRFRFFLIAVALLFVGAVVGQIRSADGYPIIDPGVGVVQAGGYPSWGDDVSVSLISQSSGTVTAALARGLYAVSCGSTCFADQGAYDVTATLTTERRIPAGFVYPLRVSGVSDTYVAFICTASTVCVISDDSYSP